MPAEVQYQAELVIYLQGQVDRLVNRDTDALLADFKTGTPPADKTDIPRICPSNGCLCRTSKTDLTRKQIVCWVVWTQTAEVSIISDAQRQEELAGLDVHE